MHLIARTQLGAVRGVALPGREGPPSAAFLGVPFARAERFAAPSAAEPWSQVRDATALGPIAPQEPDPLAAYLAQARPGAPQSEDCLSLNVWTPSCEGARPVLVWIHGGAFISGTSGAPVFDGAHLSARGDVVVVSVNYRVGALGFMHLDAPGSTNLGLRDQIAALRFIAANVAAFGGDPSRVTIFGESAGAGSVCALLTAPAARGLFAGAIVQSAAPDGFVTLDEARERKARLLHSLETDEAGLRDVDLAALLAAQGRLAKAEQWRTGMLFAPVIDADLLPASPLLAARDPGLGTAPVPVLIGTNRDELQLFKLGGPGSSAIDEAALEQAMPAALIEAYRGARSARGESLEPVDLLYAFHTDVAMRGPAILLAELRPQPTYMYLFEHASPAMAGALGSHHALEIPFCFGNLEVPGVAAYAGEGEAVARLSAEMMDAWIAFARDADPSTEALGAWPRYDASERATMIFGASSGLASDPRAPERAIAAAVLSEFATA